MHLPLPNHSGHVAGRFECFCDSCMQTRRGLPKKPSCQCQPRARLCPLVIKCDHMLGQRLPTKAWCWDRAGASTGPNTGSSRGCSQAYTCKGASPGPSLGRRRGCGLAHAHRTGASTSPSTGRSGSCGQAYLFRLPEGIPRTRQ